MDAENLVGLSVEDAQAKAKELGFTRVRTVMRDGVPQVGTCDYRTDRINVYVVDGVVTQVKGIG